MNRFSRTAALVACAGVLAACGGGGAGGLPGLPGFGDTLSESSQYAAKCEAPRSGTDPQTGSAYPDRSGSATDERRWVKAYVNESYLWYRDVPSIDPASYTGTVTAYFDALTRKGVPSKDRFSFTYPTDRWNQLSQSGVDAGYGIEWAVEGTGAARVVRAAFNEPGSPGAAAGIERGATVLSVDGVAIDDATQAGIDALNAGLFPSTVGRSTTLSIRDPNNTVRTVTLVSAAVTKSPVPQATVLDYGGRKVGYLLFNDHIATAESALVAAIEQFRSAGVADVVLDLRYNGGGFVYIASQLATMLAGPDVDGRTFEQFRYNDKRSGDNQAFGFITRRSRPGSNGLPVAFDGATLPQLGLSRVFVLTTGGTCSASESVMNALRPFMQVIQIGETSCGKPYGFTAKDNCGTSYFPIEFEGVNDAGQGGYGAGFVPGSQLLGCAVDDDFGHALGNGAERLLSTALHYQANGACPAASAVAKGVGGGGARILRAPVREAKVLLR